jgi:esterase/lipase
LATNRNSKATAALTALKRHASVKTDEVFLIGLSLGGIFAPVLANESAVRGIVVFGTLSGPPLTISGPLGAILSRDGFS